ncbi:hypothetical protein Tco_1414851 [Tanacetum coccineum]
MTSSMQLGVVVLVGAHGPEFVLGFALLESSLSQLVLVSAPLGLHLVSAWVHDESAMVHLMSGSSCNPNHLANPEVTLPLDPLAPPDPPAPLPVDPLAPPDILKPPLDPLTTPLERLVPPLDPLAPPLDPTAPHQPLDPLAPPLDPPAPSSLTGPL